MAKVIGYDEAKRYKSFTCIKCAAIVEYAKDEPQRQTYTDEGAYVYGLHCPGCGDFHRTNP